MKIGMIAMSGIRAANPDLVAAGLEMPGVVERAKVVASLPSLSLLTLAGMTPDDIEIEYHEIADLRAEGMPQGDYDAVVIATYSAQVLEAYEVADSFRARGVPVVMGGLHVKAEPDEAATHATIAVGEGEQLWPAIIDDLRRGALKPRYEQRDGDW
ncbi:MAG: cobalamin-dependent protein, partial [Phycisphaerales bacterium]|nr:cobalamin-dependent protein [Phycisphaerales bacterium]